MTLQEIGRSGAWGSRSVATRPPGPVASHARPTPDPEVVAKPKRRKFTAQYRLRILEEAESCTFSPARMGRLLRARGSVQLPASDGMAQGRGVRGRFKAGDRSSKRGRKPAERNPLSAKVHELGGERSGSAGEGAAGPPIRSWTSREKLPGLLTIQPRTREGLLMARPAARHRRSAWRPAMPSGWGCHRAVLLPSFRGPNPGHQQPRPTPARALRASERAHRPRRCSPARASSSRVTFGSRSSRRCSMKAGICALERTMYRILAV